MSIVDDPVTRLDCGDDFGHAAFVGDVERSSASGSHARVGHALDPPRRHTVQPSCRATCRRVADSDEQPVISTARPGDVSRQGDDGAASPVTYAGTGSTSVKLGVITGPPRWRASLTTGVFRGRPGPLRRPELPEIERDYAMAGAMGVFKMPVAIDTPPAEAPTTVTRGGFVKFHITTPRFSDREIVIRLPGTTWSLPERAARRAAHGPLARMLFEVLGDIWVIQRNPHFRTIC